MKSELKSEARKEINYFEKLLDSNYERLDLFFYYQSEVEAKLQILEELRADSFNSDPEPMKLSDVRKMRVINNTLGKIIDLVNK